MEAPGLRSAIWPLVSAQRPRERVGLIGRVRLVPEEEEVNIARREKLGLHQDSLSGAEGDFEVLPTRLIALAPSQSARRR